MNRPTKILPKVYLGDGAYAEIDSYGDVVLTTEDGISVQNRVVLEPEVLTALLAYLRRAGAL